MFDQWLEESLGDPGALLSLAADNHEGERRAGCRKLVLAAAWADCHGETDDPDQAATHESSVLVERFVRMGPVGTPLVAETCPSSLALAQQSSVAAARLVIGDALAIRHRLPQLWVRVQAGEVMAWKAREVARRTGELSVVSARVVDRIVTGQVERAHPAHRSPSPSTSTQDELHPIDQASHSSAVRGEASLDMYCVAA